MRSPLPRCYNISDIPSFFVEGVDPRSEVLELHMGDQQMCLTREAFISLVGSLAKMAVDLLETSKHAKSIVH